MKRNGTAMFGHKPAAPVAQPVQAYAPATRRESAMLPMPQHDHRLPPHSIEAEQGMLGCLLLDPKACIELSIAKMRGGSEVFYDLRHQALYDALAGMHEASKLIDPITLQQWLKDRNQLEALGGLGYISGLMGCTPSAANLEYYLEIIQEKFALRRLIQVCTGVVAKVYDGDGTTVADLLSECQREVMELDPTARPDDDVDIKALMARVLDRIENYKVADNSERGLMTGFYDLDQKFNGMRRGQLIILGARPSIGKSSLAMNFVENIAILQNEPCAFFSMEMEAEELGERLVSSRAEVNGERMQRGDYELGDADRMISAINTISGAPIHICDKGGMPFKVFQSRLRRMVAKFKIRLAIIDYLQLFILPGKENRSIEIGNITTGLKSLAKELKITIICLSQLNRDLEKDNRRPRTSDLRDSGSIEQDADKILLLSEEAKEEKKDKKKSGKSESDDDEVEVGCAVIIGEVAKNRSGKRGIVRFLFRKPFTRFESYSKTTDYEV